MVRETFGVGITDTYLIYGAGTGVALSAHPLLRAAAGRAQPIRQPRRPCCAANRQHPFDLT